MNDQINAMIPIGTIQESRNWDIKLGRSPRKLNAGSLQFVNQFRDLPHARFGTVSALLSAAAGLAAAASLLVEEVAGSGDSEAALVIISP